MDLIELRDIHKTYYLGEIDLPVLKDVWSPGAFGSFVHGRRQGGRLPLVRASTI